MKTKHFGNRIDARLVIFILIIGAAHEVLAEWDGEFWGAETNGVKSGLYINHFVTSTNYVIHCTPVLQSSRPAWVQLWIPPPESRFLMTLFDEKGKSVEKTAKGKALGRPITEPVRLMTGINFRAGYVGSPLGSAGPSAIGNAEFLLQDYFVVTNSGKYRLKFEMLVVWVPDGWTNSLRTAIPPPTVVLPPVEAPIEIKKF